MRERGGQRSACQEPAAAPVLGGPARVQIQTCGILRATPTAPGWPQLAAQIAPRCSSTKGTPCATQGPIGAAMRVRHAQTHESRQTHAQCRKGAYLRAVSARPCRAAALAAQRRTQRHKRFGRGGGHSELMGGGARRAATRAVQSDKQGNLLCTSTMRRLWRPLMATDRAPRAYG